MMKARNFHEKVLITILDWLRDNDFPPVTKNISNILELPVAKVASEIDKLAEEGLILFNRTNNRITLPD